MSDTKAVLLLNGKEEVPIPFVPDVGAKVTWFVRDSGNPLKLTGGFRQAVVTQVEWSEGACRVGSDDSARLETHWTAFASAEEVRGEE